MRVYKIYEGVFVSDRCETCNGLYNCNDRLRNFRIVPCVPSMTLVLDLMECLYYNGVSDDPF
jgi:hypothetical protein